MDTAILVPNVDGVLELQCAPRSRIYIGNGGGIKEVKMEQRHECKGGL